MNIKIKLENNKTICSKIIVESFKNNKYIYTDTIGLYNNKSNYILINTKKYESWISKGAKLTNKVIKILKIVNKIPH